MIKTHCPRNLVAPFEHKFIIPVEWGYYTRDAQGRTYLSMGAPNIKKVSKLRCECGEEIER